MTEQTSEQVEAVGDSHVEEHGQGNPVAVQDLPVVSPSARITRVESPAASPGCCVICGKNTHPLGFAATDNFDFEFYGTVYFCADCVGEYARLFGYLSPADFMDLRTHMESQDTELNTLRQAVLGLESTVDNLAGELARRNSGVNTSARNDNASISSFSDPVDEPDEGLPSEDSGQPVSVDGDATEQEPESVAEQGPDDLYDTTSADELLGL